MDVLTLLLRLPFLPLTGAVRLAEIIGDEAERELHDPARIRRELEEAQQRHDAGEITDEELARVEDRAAELLVPGQPSAADPADDEGS
jgi:hypothetical protein